jgi:hypothetical protein
VVTVQLGHGLHQLESKPFPSVSQTVFEVKPRRNTRNGACLIVRKISTFYGESYVMMFLIFIMDRAMNSDE